MPLNKKKFFLDMVLSIIVFVPLTAVWNLAFNKVDLQSLAVICLGSLALNVVAGGFFGRLLDWWRRRLNYQSA